MKSLGQAHTRSQLTAQCPTHVSRVHSRLAIVIRASSSHEYSSRVKGDVGRVFQFVGNYQNLPLWYPGKEGDGDTPNSSVAVVINHWVLTPDVTAEYMSHACCRGVQCACHEQQ